VATVKREIVSLIPVFELGLWNAWIFILPVIIIFILGPKILGKREHEEGSSVAKKAKTASNLYFPIMLLSYAYSIFLPLKLDTIWFIIGLLIYLPVMLFLVIGFLNLATTPVNELATRGVYGISRNPLYFGEVLVSISIGIVCLSWVFLLMTIAKFLLIHYYVVVAEEPFLIEKYGDTYREYMNRTSRWIGLPKLEKKE
jgi:protein-S-isoprenylcysteine O-methyltransferase Ste14